MAHPLSDKNFRLLFTGRVVSQLGDAVSPAALTLTIVNATRSSADLAVVLLCALLPKIALLLISGVTADRLGPRRVALAAAVVSGVAQLSIAFLLLTGHVDIPGIATAAAVKGTASAFDAPATLPLVAGTVSEGRQAANSIMGVAGSVTSLAGPALAGVLILTVGPGWAFVLDAATFWFGGCTLALLRVRPAQVPRAPFLADLIAAWAEVRARTWYWTSLVGHATWNFAVGMLAIADPFIAVTELGGRAVWIAALEASAVGYFGGALIAGRTRVSRAILVGNVALMSYAAPLILFAIAAPAWAVVVALGLAMGCLGFLNPVWETALQQEIPAAVLARVSAYDWLVSIGATPIGFVLGPVLAAHFGYARLLVGAAVLVLISLSIPIFLPDVRNLRLNQASLPG